MISKEQYELINNLEEEANDVKNLIECSLYIANDTEGSYSMNKIITLLKKSLVTIEMMNDEITNFVKDNAMSEVIK